MAYGLPVTQAAASVLSLLILFAAHVVVARSTSPLAALKALPILLLGGFGAWHAIYLSMSPAGFTLEELLPGYGMYGFLAVGYLELYLNLYRGFSYTLVSEIARDGPVTEEAICRNFADGVGERGMMERRFASMESAGLVRRTETTMTLLPRGTFIARISSFLRRFLRLDPGGGEAPPT